LRRRSDLDAQIFAFDRCAHFPWSLSAPSALCAVGFLPATLRERALASLRNSHSRRGLSIVVALALIALVGYFGWRHFYGGGAIGSANAGAQKPTPIPVAIAQVQAADFPCLYEWCWQAAVDNAQTQLAG
jgi:hypothetical protein